jgi:hypothetical protein
MSAAITSAHLAKTMDDAMYVEVWVAKQIPQPYPIVMFHGNGQTGAVWQQTPDGRPGAVPIT